MLFVPSVSIYIVFPRYLQGYRSKNKSNLLPSIILLQKVCPSGVDLQLNPPRPEDETLTWNVLIPILSSHRSYSVERSTIFWTISIGNSLTPPTKSLYCTIYILVVYSILISIKLPQRLCYLKELLLSDAECFQITRHIWVKLIWEVQLAVRYYHILNILLSRQVA